MVLPQNVALAANERFWLRLRRGAQKNPATCRKLTRLGFFCAPSLSRLKSLILATEPILRQALKKFFAASRSKYISEGILPLETSPRAMLPGAEGAPPPACRTALAADTAGLNKLRPGKRISTSRPAPLPPRRKKGMPSAPGSIALGVITPYSATPPAFILQCEIFSMLGSILSTFPLHLKQRRTQTYKRQPNRCSSVTAPV